MRFHVADMSCGHCRATIETALRDAGATAQVDLDSHTVEVHGIDESRAAQVIRDAGYTPAPA